MKQPDQIYRGCLLHFNAFTQEWVAIKDSFRIYANKSLDEVKRQLDSVYA